MKLDFEDGALEAIADKALERKTGARALRAILEEFMATLNYKYPVAKEFKSVYEYLHERLVAANLKKDAAILNEVLEHLRGMRDTWKEVMHVVNTQKSASSE